MYYDMHFSQLFQNIYLKHKLHTEKSPVATLVK